MRKSRKFTAWVASPHASFLHYLLFSSSCMFSALGVFGSGTAGLAHRALQQKWTVFVQAADAFVSGEAALCTSLSAHDSGQ